MTNEHNNSDHSFKVQSLFKGFSLFTGRTWVVDTIPAEEKSSLPTHTSVAATAGESRFAVIRFRT